VRGFTKEAILIMREIITEQKKIKKPKPFAIPRRNRNLKWWLEKLGYQKSGAFLGLDIGSSTVKIVQLEKTQNGWELVKAGVEGISSIAERKEEENITPLVVRTIRHILQKEKIKIDKVVSSICGDGVTQRIVKVPKMEKKELYQALTWEAKKFVNWPSSETVLDYLIAGQKENQIEVFLVVAKKRSVEEQISLIKACGLKPLAIETTSLALNSALFFTDAKEIGKNLCLLHLGAQSTILNISRDEIPRFSREIKMGGDDLTYAIAHQSVCDLNDAEELKKEVGLELKKEDREVESEQRKLIRGLISDQMEKLVNEVNRSFDYFRAEYPGENIEMVGLCGGGAKLKGLDRFLEGKFKRKVEAFDPFKFISNTEYGEPIKDIAPDLALALGLAAWRGK
jgi:type IV pilus assembly protein PilM